MNIAILGGGVVGQCYADAFAAQGHCIVGVADVRPSAQLLQWAGERKIALHPAAGEWLHAADLVVSAVFGTVALDVARMALPHLAGHAIYVDMTTADPADMAQANELAGHLGHQFVDVAITGAVNLSGARTPLLCAGDKAETVRELYASIGASIRVVGSKPGDAATLKLLRSIFTKGMEALTIECLVTAEKRGLRAELHKVLSDIDEGSLPELMESMVRTHIAHAGRRRNEVVEAQQQMRLSGVDPVVMPAVQQLFERTAAAPAFTQFDGKDTAAALNWLAQLAPAASVTNANGTAAH